MPKKKSRDTPAAQSRRFVETAKSLEADENGVAFESALKIIAPTKHPPKPGNRGKK